MQNTCTEKDMGTRERDRERVREKRSQYAENIANFMKITSIFAKLV